MDCREAEELFGPYLLGALDAGEESLIDAHLETCRICGPRLQADGETVARLASAVPELEVPPRIKRQLLSRIAADSKAGRLARLGSGLLGLRGALTRPVAPHAGKAVASVLALSLVFGGVWFHSRLDRLEENNEQLSGQLEVAAGRDVDLLEMVEEQRNLTYEALLMSAAPGTSVNMLWGTGWSPSARGMVLVSRTGTEALLLVLHLPPLPAELVYQVWLVKDGQKYNGGYFTVDSTGSGQAVIISVAPLVEFEGIGITIEPAGGSAGPTGTSVLKGDM